MKIVNSSGRPWVARAALTWLTLPVLVYLYALGVVAYSRLGGGPSSRQADLLWLGLWWRKYRGPHGLVECAVLGVGYALWAWAHVLVASFLWRIHA